MIMVKPQKKWSTRVDHERFGSKLGEVKNSVFYLPETNHESH